MFPTEFSHFIHIFLTSPCSLVNDRNVVRVVVWLLIVKKEGSSAQHYCIQGKNSSIYPRRSDDGKKWNPNYNHQALPIYHCLIGFKLGNISIWRKLKIIKHILYQCCTNFYGLNLV